jgi:hypothetical protein
MFGDFRGAQRRKSEQRGATGEKNVWKPLAAQLSL